MKTKLAIFIGLFSIVIVISCRQNERASDMNIIFLHHSTGEAIWKGTEKSYVTKAVRKISTQLADNMGTKARLPILFEHYNREHNSNYIIKEMVFPKAAPYGWHNYPYDYYNIWVKNGGSEYFMEEPTLEILTKQYQVIIFKHCFPASNIQTDQDTADINSDIKTISNYKLQYEALRDKLAEYPDTKFILFTGAVQVKANITEDEAIRAKGFFAWVINEWDKPDDNIYLWDFYSLETEGGLYFKDGYAESPNNSHPNASFADQVASLLFNRIIDIIEKNGSETQLNGEKK